MIKKALLALSLAAATLVGSKPASAIPPTGDVLVVIAYYSDYTKTQIVGQWWSGCGRPPSSWGVTTGPNNVYFTPC